MGELRRGLKLKQIKTEMLSFSVVGNTGTPVKGGMDQNSILSITDVGVGNYTVIFNKAYLLAVVPVGLVMITDELIGRVTAVDVDRITIQLDDATDGTTAKDGDCYITVLGTNHRFFY